MFSSRREQALVSSCGLQVSHCGGLSHVAWAVEGGLSSSTRVWLPRGMWDLPGLGIKPMSPAWAGGFLTTGQPGKS